ncbi:hypothetical protein ACCO45_005711 [Purpureocillium lilacinum]|uniref:Uncharacterized protein n=1 Tax=Purpureocillium lilacinum TaxID=33203 RepID=A0ACC4DXK6_PURLI
MPTAHPEGIIAQERRLRGNQSRPLQRPTASTTRRVRYRSVRVAAAAAAAPAHAAAAVAVLLHLVLLVLLLEGVLQDVGTHGTGAHSRDGAKHATAGLVRRPAGRAAAYQRGAEAALALRPAGATGAAKGHRGRRGHRDIAAGREGRRLATVAFGVEVMASQEDEKADEAGSC